MNLLEAKGALARKLDIDYSDIANNGLFTDDDLEGYINFGVFKSWDFKPWPFTQKTKTATLSADIYGDYYDFPQDLMMGSIRLLKVAGKEYHDLSIEAYMEYLQENPTGTARIWAPNETYIFINKNSYASGATLDLYGKNLPPVLSVSTDLLPFSPVTDGQEHSGNEAIIQLAYAEALDSEKKKNPQAAQAERAKAYDSLNILWKPFADAIARQNQTGRPMFSVPTFFRGGGNSSGAPIGNFPFIDRP